MKKTPIIIIISILLLTACAKNILPGYMPYDQIPEGYTPEDAIADGVVVHKDGDVKYGQDAFMEFVRLSQSGKPCMVRIAQYWTLDDPSHYDPAYYAEIKNDYPCLYILDLTYDGHNYTLHSIEDGREYNFTLKHLVRMEDVPSSKSAVYSLCVRYVLVNDDTLTWEDILRSMTSSQWEDHIDNHWVYSDYTYKDPNRNP